MKKQLFDDIVDAKPEVTFKEEPNDTDLSEQNEPLLTLDPPAKKRLEASDEDYDSFV